MCWFLSVDNGSGDRPISRTGTLRGSLPASGAFRYDLVRKGPALHISQDLTGATAVVMDGTFVTSNIKDYPMCGLTVLWLGS